MVANDLQVTIVLLDDESSVNRKVKYALRRNKITSHNLNWVTTAEELLGMYKDGFQNPDLILVDQNLKTSLMNGVQVIQQLRAKYNGSACICGFSGTPNKEEIQEMDVAGADYYIQKTGSIKDLASMLRQALDLPLRNRLNGDPMIIIRPQK